MAKTLPTQLSICKNLERLVHQVEGFLSAQQLGLFFSQGFPVKNFPIYFSWIQLHRAISQAIGVLATSFVWMNQQSLAFEGCFDVIQSGILRYLQGFLKVFFCFSHMEGAVFDPQISGCQQKHLRTLWCIRKKNLTMLLLGGKTWPNTDLFQKDLGTKCKVLHSW